jgi:folate-binding protein YgfZ
MPSAIARLSSRAVISVTGDDWRSFLQGLLTQDVESLAPGELRFAALLTPQGRLIHDLFLLGRPKDEGDDGCWIDVQADQRADLLRRLTTYRLRAKATLAEVDAEVFARWDAAAAGEGWAIDPRLPALGLRGYGVTVADAEDEDAYEAHRLALGVPGPADWAGETTYPIEANFDLLNGIDFKKGCFVGQETTSRMKRRGQIRSRMLPITFDGDPPPFGAEVLAGTLRAGEVLSSGEERAIALVRLDRIDGANLTIDGYPVTVEQPDWLAPETA